MIIIPSNSGGVKNVTFKGANGVSLGEYTNYCTIPTHNVGDLLLAFFAAPNRGDDLAAPTAGGTVPTWTRINPGQGGASLFYAVATRTDTTSGNFYFQWSTNASLIIAVFSGQGSSPIGGYSASTYTYNNAAITLSNASGSSQIFATQSVVKPIYPYGYNTGLTGWTKALEVNGYSNYIFAATKNDTTSDGAIYLQDSGNNLVGPAAMIEIKP